MKTLVMDRAMFKLIVTFILRNTFHLLEQMNLSTLIEEKDHDVVREIKQEQNI